MPQGIITSIKARLSDPLRRSSDALIIGTGITSVLGLAFWALAARWLPTDAVGVGAALMATITLLANFSTLGMRNALLRFLPAAGAGTTRLILTCYAVCAGAAMLAAIIFLAGQPLWADKLGFLRENPLTSMVFVFGTAIWVIFVLQDQVLIGLRRTGWVPLQNGLSSVLKIVVLPLVAGAAIWAIFMASILPAFLAVVFITALVLRYARQAAASDSRLASEPRVPLSKLVRFAASDHFATLLWFATTDVLTLIVLHVSGAEVSAYWYMANAIGYSLYLVTSNVGSALIAESAHDPEHSIIHARKALAHSAQLVIPAAIIGILLAPFALNLMGAQYAKNATPTLQLILASAVPQLIVGISVSTARVRGHMGTVVGVYVFTAATIWGGSVFALQIWGLTGVGIVILLNQSIVALFLLATGKTGLGNIGISWRAMVLNAEKLLLTTRRKRNERRSDALLGRALEACGMPKAKESTMLVSDADTLVMAVGDTTEPMVIKIAISAAASQGLDHHGQHLNDLATLLEPDLLAVIPKMIRHGKLDGQLVLVESKLPGLTISETGINDAASRAALKKMGKIHEATRRIEVVDATLLAHLIDEPIAIIRRGYGMPGVGAKLDRIIEVFHRAWLGREVELGYVHGDFWPGNVLAEDCAQDVCISGIIDWEDACRRGLPDTDLVHWWLSTQPGEIGDVVRAALDDSQKLRADFDRFGITLPNSDLEIEHIILLAWIMHVSSGFARATTNKVGLVWIARNVSPIVRLFDADASIATAGKRR